MALSCSLRWAPRRTAPWRSKLDAGTIWTEISLCVLPERRKTNCHFSSLRRQNVKVALYGVITISNNSILYRPCLQISQNKVPFIQNLKSTIGQREKNVPIWLHEGKLETQTLTWLATGYTKGWMLSVHVTWLCSGLDHDGQRILSHKQRLEVSWNHFLLNKELWKVFGGMHDNLGKLYKSSKIYF